MTAESDQSEKPRGYQLCFVLILIPIIGLFTLPLSFRGIEFLPNVLLFTALVILPLIACNIGTDERITFIWHYHGDPTVMRNLLDSEMKDCEDRSLTHTSK